MIIPAQVTVGTTGTFLANVPAGPATVIITVAGGTQNTIYLGAGSAVTTATGAPIEGGVPFVMSGYPSSSAVTLYAVAAASTTAGVTIITDR